MQEEPPHTQRKLSLNTLTTSPHSPTCSHRRGPNTPSKTSRLRGITVIIDGRKGPWKVARSCIRQVNVVFSTEELAQSIVLRPDAFWDKQRVEYCTSSQKDKQVIFIPRSRLNKYVDQSQLPVELGGNFDYKHDKWLETRKRVEDFYTDSEITCKEQEELHQHVLKSSTLRPSQLENAIKTSTDMAESTKMLVHNVTETGKELIEGIENENRIRKLAAEDADLSMSSPQDTLDTIETIDDVVKRIKRKQKQIDDAWMLMEKIHADTKDLIELEEGVFKVINWILGYGEVLLNSRQEVAYDIFSAEELSKEHDNIELQCWETYGVYAEIINEIGVFSNVETLLVQHRDLIAQKDYMDYVCRSFALRLANRRNIVTTSLRFYSLVAEYYERTGDVFDFLIRRSNVADFELAGQKLKELKENQEFLDAVQHELVKEGEKLSELLLMPVKDTLGKDLNVDYTEDIFNLRDIIEGTNARRNIFTDSVEFQKITLEQVIHIDNYEKYTNQAIQWLEELLQIMLRDHCHVGCSINEIQKQKEEHQSVQETAKATYHYGCKLLNASLVLRQSCRLPLEKHANLYQKLRTSWQRLFSISQEQMTRLRVSTIFHRSIEEQMNHLRDLRESVATILLMDSSIKKERVNYYFGLREKLMVDVGRTIRVGRLLKSRMKEPLCQSEKLFSSFSSSRSEEFEKIFSTTNNEVAIDSISEKLTEVTLLAEELDQALASAEQDCLVFSTTSKLVFTTSFSKCSPHRKAMETTLSQPEKVPKSEDHKSDEEFLTASDSTMPHSRSSSYNTASECEHRYSPWWDHGKDDTRPDVTKEKMVLAVGLPELPSTKEVLKASPEVPPGKIVHEVTETTHIKVQHSHTMGVSSFVLTSETVKEKEGDEGVCQEDIVRVTETEGSDVVVTVDAEKEIDEDEIEKRIKEVGSSDERPWSSYHITKQAMKGFII